MPTPVSRPANYSLPFASSGTKNTIPVASTGTGAASFTDGFPAVTMMPITAGGVPPQGKDFNGILYDITSHTIWLNAGGQYQFDSALSTAIGGYPAGMVLQNTAGTSAYVSAVNNNTTDFNATPSSIGTLWLPWAGAAVIPAPNTIVFNSNISPSLSNAAIQFLDTATSGTQVVTITASGLTPGQMALSIANIGGGTAQFKNSSGVYVNFKASTASGGIVSAQSWASLLSAGITQGIWGNATSYGSAVQPTATTGGWYGTAKILTLSATQVVIAWADYGTSSGNASSQVSLVVWNPTTKTAGTAVTLATVYAQGDIFLYQTGASTFAVFGGQFATTAGGFPPTGAVCTVAGSSIATGTVATGPAGILGTGSTGGLLTSGCALSTSTFVFGYQASSSTVAAAQVLVATVSGTTVTFGTLQSLGGATSATPAAPSVMALSATSGVALGITSGTTSQQIAFTISGTTITPGTAVAMPASTNLLTPSGVTNGVLALKAGSAGLTAMASTVSGTTITAGSSATISASGSITNDPQGILPTQAGIGSGNNAGAICVYSAGGQFAYVGAVGMIPFSITGTVITIGTTLLSGHVVLPSLAPDGTWGYVDTTSGNIGTFTISANAIALGATIGTVAALAAHSGLSSANAAYMAAFESYSSTHMCAFIQVSGVWYPYYGAKVSAGNSGPKYTINTAGDAIMAVGSGLVIGNLQSNFK